MDNQSNYPLQKVRVSNNLSNCQIIWQLLVGFVVKQWVSLKIGRESFEQSTKTPPHQCSHQKSFDIYYIFCINLRYF